MRKINLSRRDFVMQSLVATAALSARQGTAAEAQTPAVSTPPALPITHKIKVGIVGGGHRGNLIGGFMKSHGGFEIHAVTDYFPETADALGETFGVNKARRFSGLSGYKKTIDSGIDALVIMDVPCFYPEQAKAAVDADLHVYMAKPFAVDVPGCLLQLETAKRATAKKRCVLVDYQIPLDKANKEVAKRIHEGGVEGLSHICSGGQSSVWGDPAKGKTIENLLRGGVWLSSVNLGGDNIVSYDIHIIDGVTWIMGKRPITACGFSKITRPNPQGDRTDCGSVTYHYDDGTIWSHVTQALANNAWMHNLGADFMGCNATATINYWGKSQIRGGPKHVVGSASNNIYNDGAEANVAEFYRCIIEEKYDNPTAFRAVDGTLTAILGREAMARRGLVRMEDLLRENRKLELDLSGLKA
ncbi:MAG: Gfo/Idh/MocA family oxidoreductase [bacterium]